MESENRGFIVTHYTDVNGYTFTRDQVIDKILNMIDGHGLTSSQITQKLRMSASSIYNILSYMVQHHMIIKERIGNKSKFIFRRVQECLLADLLYPTPEQIEQSFKIIDRTKRTVDQGTSKGFGRKSIDPYGFNYLNSVYWEGAD